MVTLVWDAPGTRYFETGVDRGVLYSTNNVGIPWNGLTGVTESVEGASSTPLYIDGQKFQIAQVFGDFSATIEAYSAPKEFSAHDGTPFGMNGLGFGLQPKKPFGFSYRTRVGNDEDREDFGYKVHLVYNAYATPTGVSHSTLGSSVDPQKLSWDISTIPTQVIGKRPTAHLVIDSRYVDSALLGIIEGYLYGANGIIPALPTAQQISDLFAVWTAIGIDGLVNYQGIYSADYTTLTNLATNPSFETTSGTVDVRTNLATTYSSANGATFTTPSGPERSTTVTPVSGATNSGVSFGPSAVAGENRTVSIEVEAIADTAVRLVSTGGGPSTTAVNLLAGQVTTLSAVGTFTASGQIYLTATSATAGAFIARNPLIEKSTIVEPTFNGSTPPKIQRNAFRNPGATSANWFSSYAGTTGNIKVDATVDADWSKSGKAKRVTWTDVSGNAGNGDISVVVGTQTSVAAITPYSTWTVEFDIVVGRTLVLGPPALYAPSGVASTIARSSSFDATLQAGDIRHAWVTFTADATAVSDSMRITNTPKGKIAGDYAEISNVVMYPGEYVGAQYLSGAMTPPPGYAVAWEGSANNSPSYLYDSDLTPVWTGTANATASILRGTAVATVSSFAPERAVRFASTRWLRSGTKSVRVVPGVSGNPSGSYAAVTINGLTIGRTYTILGYVHLERTLTPPLIITDGVSLGFWVIGSPNPVVTYSRTATNAPGTYEVRGAFTANATSNGIRLMNGAGFGNGDVWWDDLLVIEGDYTGPYFDGSSPNFVYRGQETDPYWASTPNASVSNIKLYDDLPEVAADNDARLIGSELWVRINGVWRNKGVVPQIT